MSPTLLCVASWEGAAAERTEDVCSKRARANVHGDVCVCRPFGECSLRARRERPVCLLPAHARRPGVARTQAPLGLHPGSLAEPPQLEKAVCFRLRTRVRKMPRSRTLSSLCTVVGHFDLYNQRTTTQRPIECVHGLGCTFGRWWQRCPSARHTLASRRLQLGDAHKNNVHFFSFFLF